MADSQMNIRIDQEAKERGDAVFGRLGYSPSQVVRMVWQYASDHGHEPGILSEAIGEIESETNKAERERRIAASEEGVRIVTDFRKKFGLTRPKDVSDILYNELRLEAYYEKMDERIFS